MEDSMGRKTASGIIVTKGGGCSITFREQKFHDRRSIRYCNRLGCCASRYAVQGTQVGEDDDNSFRSSSSKSSSPVGFREPRLKQRLDEEDAAESSNRRKCSVRSLDKSNSVALRPAVRSKLSSRASKGVARQPKSLTLTRIERDVPSGSEDYGNDFRQDSGSFRSRSPSFRGKSINSSVNATSSVSSRGVTLDSNQTPRRSISQSTNTGVVSVRTRPPVGELETVDGSSSRSSRDAMSLIDAFSEDNDGFPHLNRSIAEVLLELERIEHQGSTLEEQLSFLENCLFLDGLISDQYRDMRMDIDNMTYEELLALGEEMGTVSTALTEEALSKCLKRSNYAPSSSLISGFSRSDDGDAKCSICQEEWVGEDEIGTLACEHFYHDQCIDQWLRLKNWCPICKASVIPTPST